MGSWTTAFAAMADKNRLNVTKAGARDASAVCGLILRLLETGAAELKDLVPLDSVPNTEPSVCAAVVEGLRADSFPATVSKEAQASEVGLAILERAAAVPAGGDEKEKRKVIGPSGKKEFGKSDNSPVFVCEGISGSHQKMEIKKGL